MAHYTADEVITMMDVSDLEDQESDDSGIEKDPEFPLLHSNSGTEESDDESPTHLGSLLRCPPTSPSESPVFTRTSHTR